MDIKPKTLSLLYYIKNGKKSLFKGEWSLTGGTLMMILVYLTRGIFSYVYLFVAVRMLGTIAYGSFSVLYSGFTMVGFVLGQSFETLISKYVAEATSQQLYLGNLFRKISTAFGIITAVIILFGLIFNDYLMPLLFSEDPILYWFMICVGIGESIDMTSRGILRGLRAIGLYGVSFVINMALRFFTLVIFVQVFQMGLRGAVIGLILSMCLSIFVNIAFYLKLKSNLTENFGGIFIINNHHLSQYLFSMLWMFIAMAFYYHSGPMLIKATGGENAPRLAGMFMLATYLTRIPAQLAESLTVNLLPHLASKKAQADMKESWITIRKSIQILIPFGLLSVAGLYFLGPWILSVFSNEYTYTRNGIVLLALSGFLIILLNVLSQLLLSRSKTRQIAFAWFVGCGIFFGSSLLHGIPIITRLELGYLVSSLIMFLLVYLSAKSEVNAR